MNKIRISALSILLVVGVSLPASAALFAGTGGLIPALGTKDVSVTVSGLTGPQVLILNMPIFHSSFPDLVISVISPSGVSTAFVSNHGGSANTDLNGTYNILDGAAATLQSQTVNGAVPPGSYKPLDAFSGFQALSDGDLNGTWIVRFADTVDNSIGGTLGTIGLDFTAVPEPATAGVMAAALLGVVAAVQGWRNRTRKLAS